MTWTIATAKARLGITDDAQDAAVQSAMDVALAAAESYCDRRFLLQDDEQEFPAPYGPTLLVRRWPLVSMATIAPFDPQAEPPPDPAPVPAGWRMDKKRGVIYMVGQGASNAGGLGIAPVGSAPPPGPWPMGYGSGVVLTYRGGYDPLPADLEAALWMVFDNVWATTPGWGLPAGSTGGAGTGAVRSFGIDGMSISYDTGTSGSGSVGAGRAEAWGLLPANAVGILDFYRAESAALGG